MRVLTYGPEYPAGTAAGTSGHEQRRACCLVCGREEGI